MSYINIIQLNVMCDKHFSQHIQDVLGGQVVNVLAIGPKVRWLKPGRVRQNFKGDTSTQHAFH
jgi:hypothetical protein